MRVHPFHAVRYQTNVAGPPSATSAPPYSDLDRFDYAAHRTANPYTVLELLTAEAGATAELRYGAARATLDRWLRTGVLRRDDDPTLSIYEQVDPATGHRQRGVVGLLDTDDVRTGALLPHEDVTPARARSRAERLRHVPVDLTPVVAVHLGADEQVTAAIDRPRGEPAVELVDENGVAHRLWTITDAEEIHAVVSGLASVTAVLADGHHRLAAAQALVELPDGPAGAGHTLGLVLDASSGGPRLRALHRRVHSSHPDPVRRLDDVAGVAVAPWSGSRAELTQDLEEGPRRRFGVITAAGCWLVSLAPDAGADVLAERGVPAPLAAVDMTLLHEVLYPAMGVYADDVVVDPATDADPAAPSDALVLLAPPSVQQVLEVARADLRMPAKTTWFWPKPRAGLLLRLLTED